MYTFLALAGLASGFVNSLAGGGVVFPALIIAGLPAIDANASSTVALFPIQFVSAWASIRVLSNAFAKQRKEIIVLATIGLGGGVFGAVLLLVTPPNAFAQAVPWLLLIATTAFAWRVCFSSFGRSFSLPLPLRRVLYSFVAIYGGFFGGGVGILILAVLGSYGMKDIREMNSLKVLLSGLIGCTASVLFAFSGHVHWRETILMMITAAIGAFLGTRFGMLIPRRHVEIIVIFVGISLVVYFFAGAIPA